MAKLLIINPNADTFGRQSIPTVLIAALLKQHGHRVELFDTTFMDCRELFGLTTTHETLAAQLQIFPPVATASFRLRKEAVDVVRQFEAKLASYRPDLIAFSFWGSHLHGEGEFHAFFHGLRLVERANTGEIPIVVGGTVPTWATREVLRHPKINGVVRGEGELAYLDIANRLEQKQALTGIKNLWLDRGRGELEENELRPLIDPLDQLPHADFSIYDDRSLLRPYHGRLYRGVDYELSRGCVYHCSFCLSPFQRKQYGYPGNFRREKSIGKIIDEISHLKARYRLELIRYQDESFLSMEAGKLKELARAYRQRVDLPFIIEAAINTVTEEKIVSLKEMGCVSVGLGIESGSQRLRDTVIRKPRYTNADALANIALIKRHGLSLNLYNIIGFPDETRAMIFETIALNYRARPPYCMVSYFQPWEGTALRDEAIERGYLRAASQGLENSRDSLLDQPVHNPHLSKAELSELHRKFIYYVHLHQWLWPLLDRMDATSRWSRAVTRLFNVYLRLRMKYVG